MRLSAAPTEVQRGTTDLLRHHFLHPDGTRPKHSPNFDGALVPFLMRETRLDLMALEGVDIDDRGMMPLSEAASR